MVGRDGTGDTGVRQPRPGAEGRLAEALQAGLTLVTARAGSGKTDLLSAVCADRNSAWHTVPPGGQSMPSLLRDLVASIWLRVPDLTPGLLGLTGATGPATNDVAGRAHLFAATLCDALDGRLPRDLLLVVDATDRLAADRGATALLEGLARHAPSELHVVLSGRTPPGFPVARLAERGGVVQLGDGDLTCTEDEVARIVGDEAAGEPGPWTVHRARLRATACRRGLPVPPGAGAEVLLSAIGASLSADEAATHDLIATAGPVPRSILTAVRGTGAEAAVEALLATGLLRTDGSDPTSLEAVVPECRFAASVEVTAAIAAEVSELAVALADTGRDREALAVLRRAGQGDAAVSLLRRVGRGMLARGGWAEVLDVVAGLGDDGELDDLRGEAYRLAGDWDAALQSLESAAARVGALPAWLGWRIGIMHHLRGDLGRAMEVYGSIEDADDDAADVATADAWHAAAHWLRGDVTSCRDLVERAMQHAIAAGDDAALASAHTVRAMLAASAGDRAANDRHYLEALVHADRAGDALQRARIHVNRASHHLEEGDLPEALAELEIGVPLAELTGVPSLFALALSNRGAAYRLAGRLDEAAADLRASRDLFQQAGSRFIAYPLGHLGDVLRARGDRTLARSAYEEAIAHASPTHDVQGLVPALTGLALTVLEEEPELARDAAERAVDCGESLAQAEALAALARVQFVSGDRDAAIRTNQRGLETARARRDRAGLARNLEVAALLAATDAERSAALEEARGLWDMIGSVIEVARVDVAIADVRRGPAAVAASRRAARVLRLAGARAAAVEADEVRHRIEQRDEAPVRVVALGGFRVVRGGEVVPPTAWQSRKARDLLKVLVTRRGRAIPRDGLIDVLWPESHGDAGLGNRLSVALATARGVLDPARSYPNDHFVRADADAISLDLTHVDVDVERFLEQATAGLAGLRQGDHGEAQSLLESADGLYTGDLFDDDPYADWAVALREEVRVTYLAVLGGLAEMAIAAREDLAAARLLLRLLAHDPYDETTHLLLVRLLERGGRRGEARRHYRTYLLRMQELGVEPAPFPT